MPFNPEPGFPFELRQVPPEMLAEDGWVDPLSLRDAVFEALAHSVGGVVAIGAGSFDVFVWRDVDSAGRKCTFAGGEWKTEFVETPAELLDCLEELGVEPAARPQHAERKLRVRYWHIRRSRGRKPGRVQLQVNVYARPIGVAQGQPVVVPGRVQCLARDFVEELET